MNADDTDAAPNSETTGPPRWVKTFGIIALVLLLLVVLVLITRGPGSHGPGRHTSETSQMQS